MDIDKILKENQDLKSNYDLLVKERKEIIQFIKSIDCPPSKKCLVGPVELTKHVVNHLIKSRDLAVEDMKDTRTIKMVKDALTDWKSGVLSPASCLIVINSLMNPVTITQKDRERAAELSKKQNNEL